MLDKCITLCYIELMIQIKGLVWDEWNRKHIGKHKVTPAEVNQACNLIKKSLSSYGGRLIVIGETKKARLLTIVLAPESKNKYYVVTARTSSRKERRLLND